MLLEPEVRMRELKTNSLYEPQVQNSNTAYFHLTRRVYYQYIIVSVKFCYKIFYYVDFFALVIASSIHVLSSVENVLIYFVVLKYWLTGLKNCSGYKY